MGFWNFVEKALSNLDENQIQKLSDAVDFVSSVSVAARGGKVQHLQVNGIDASSKASHIGEAFGKTIKTTIDFLTPDQWRQVGALAFKIASFNIPLLGMINWEKIIDIADSVTESGGNNSLVNSIDWNTVGAKLLEAKNQEENTSTVQTIEEMLKYVNILQGNQNQN